jgi:hypothetical protein
MRGRNEESRTNIKWDNMSIGGEIAKVIILPIIIIKKKEMDALVVKFLWPKIF